MASPTKGTYRIVSAKGSSSNPFSLDVSGGSNKNGANVQIYTPNHTGAQFFVLSYRKDNTAQILSEWSGKSLDIENGTVASGTNIQQYTDNDTRAQSWVIATDGGSATYNGDSYPTHTVKIVNSDLAMDIAGGAMASGTNVRVYTSNGTEAQQWLFVPAPPFASGGRILSLMPASSYFVQPGSRMTVPFKVKSSYSPTRILISVFSAKHSSEQKTATNRRMIAE